MKALVRTAFACLSVVASLFTACFFVFCLLALRFPLGCFGWERAKPLFLSHHGHPTRAIELQRLKLHDVCMECTVLVWATVRLIHAFLKYIEKKASQERASSHATESESIARLGSVHPSSSRRPPFLSLPFFASLFTPLDPSTRNSRTSGRSP